MRRYQQIYHPAPDRDERLRSAVALGIFAVTARELHAEHRKLVCKQAAWYATECDGKLTPRFRTPAAMAFDGPRYWSVLRHEHVYTLASLAEQMLAQPDQVERILRGAVACLVTKDEHDRLTLFDRTHVGWDRYQAAGVPVVDALTQEVIVAGDATSSPRVSAPAGQTHPHARRPGLGDAGIGSTSISDFWRILGTRLDTDHPEWRRAAPIRNSQGFPGPAKRTRFQFDFSRQGLRHQLLLASTEPSENDQRLVSLKRSRRELEESYGGPLRLEPLPGRVQTRVADYLPGNILERERWDEFSVWFISSGCRLREALGTVSWDRTDHQGGSNG
jgi:hypothetical protein